MALGFLIQQAIVDPTGADSNITINGQSRDSWPEWVLWLIWGGVALWLLIAIGVLVLRLSILRDLRTENAWVYEHGVAYSIHRTSVDHDDGEGVWATYIALDHRLDSKRAARIYHAFERWLTQGGMPPAGSKPISSATLFGSEAAGGYFILHLPVPATAGDTAEHRWMLITEPHQDDNDSDGEVLVTPVPVPKKLEKIRRKLHRKARRSARWSPRR
ncbi:hypothetical protein ACFWHT_08185 [Microbacterium sp. NPDC058342]|uniref:hypothetical protein n=1 Tax=Microbacterium sp. NPDC058342 TaxID=3346454 RepID=UPI00366877C2